MLGMPIHYWNARFLFNFLLGFWVADKAGKMRELKSGMPQLDRIHAVFHYFIPMVLRDGDGF